MNESTTAQNGQCLNEDLLTEYLEGTLDPVVKNACEVHLIGCDPCRQNLALVMKVLQEESTPEEQAALGRLSEIWERRNLRPVPAPKRWSFATQVLVPAVGLAAILLVAIGLGWNPWSTPPSAASQIMETLVASIRPFEPRIVGQPYREIQEVTRGVENLVPDALAAEMTETSVAAYELGRFFLLQKQYAKAIRHLKTAVADPKGVPADVHNDLGVAYLESGEPYVAAAEAEFKGALTRDPGHAPALFNLSILYERQSRFTEAAERRHQYLELDPDSGWAKELEKKLLRKESAEP